MLSRYHPKCACLAAWCREWRDEVLKIGHRAICEKWRVAFLCCRLWQAAQMGVSVWNDRSSVVSHLRLSSSRLPLVHPAVHSLKNFRAATAKKKCWINFDLKLQDYSRAKCPWSMRLYHSLSNVYNRWVDRMPFDHSSIWVVLSSISDPRDLVAEELARRLDLIQNTSIW